MKFSATFLCLGVLFLIAFTVPALCEEIQISPSTLNLANTTSTWVTVHTDIAYSSVVGATVSLDGVEIEWWKSDNRGNFVAKFDSREVKALLEINDSKFPASVTLTLTGKTTDENTFSESGIITVINVTGKK